VTGPWKPLSAYGGGDKTLFFGRDREADALVELLLGERRAALLFGEAGVGKSSLVQAGLAPRLRARKVEMLTIDCTTPSAVELPPRGQEQVAVIEEPDAALYDRASAARLVELLQQGAQNGWRFLFVADDEALGRILPLEERIGALFGPGGRLRLERFDSSNAAEAIEQTFLGSGAYVEAGLSQTVAEELTSRSAVSPSLLQIALAQATAERVTTADGYRKTGGAQQLLYRFLDRACEAAGEGAVRVLSEIASRERRALLSVDALAQATGIAPGRVDKIVERLGAAKLVKESAAGVVLGSEWLRPRARDFVAETRGRTARVRRMLDLKVARRGLLSPRQVREIGRYAGGLDDQQGKVVARSKMAFRAAIAVCVLVPLSGIGVVWRSYGKRFTLDENGGEIVARLGPKSAKLGFLPHSPSLGTIVGATGLSRAAFAEEPKGREGDLDGDRWMHEAENALLPLPHGITALALDGEVAPLQSAATDPALVPRSLEVLAVLGSGSAAERNLLDQALADKSEDVRRRAVAAAASLEGRVPGVTGKALDTALDDKAASVRAAALDVVIARGSAPSLARALGSSDAGVRKRAAAALGPIVKDHADAVAGLAAALAGPGRADAEPIVATLIEGNGPAATAMVGALAQTAADPKGDLDLRIGALKLLRHAPAPPADLIEKALLAGPAKVTGAALPLLTKVDPARGLVRVAEARGPIPVRAGAAAALAFLPKDPDTPKRLKIALADGAAEVRAEAVRASPVLGREARAILGKVLRGEQADVERAAIETLSTAKLGGEAPELLSQLAQKGKPALRKPAIDALATMKAAGVLVALTRAKEPEIRKLAALALGASPQLRALAKDPDPSVRKAAVQALGSSKGGAGAKALVAFLGDGEAEVRAAAATALGSIGASDALVPLVADKEPAVRAAARRGLAANPIAKPGADLEKAIGRAFSDGEADERAALTDLSANLPSLLRRAAADSDPAVRKAAARAAFAGKASDVLKLLAADADREVRRAAIDGLANLGAVAELQAVLAVEPDPAVRAAAIVALPDGDAARALREKALADPSEQIRAAAARGLGAAAAERARIEGALKDPAADVRAAAVEALGRIAAADGVDELVTALQSAEADAELRWATAEALARKASAKTGGAAAVAALEKSAAAGPPGSRIAARVARGFVGRADEMHDFVVAYRRGR
jgi:HEAT repeat protein